MNLNEENQYMMNIINVQVSYFTYLSLIGCIGPFTTVVIKGKLKKIANNECKESKSHYKVFNVHGKRGSYDSRSIMVFDNELF